MWAYDAMMKTKEILKFLYYLSLMCNGLQGSSELLLKLQTRDMNLYHAHWLTHWMTILSQMHPAHTIYILIS